MNVCHNSWSVLKLKKWYKCEQRLDLDWSLTMFA
jgi:hypothetical protein